MFCFLVDKNIFFNDYKNVEWKPNKERKEHAKTYGKLPWAYG